MSRMRAIHTPPAATRLRTAACVPFLVLLLAVSLASRDGGGGVYGSACQSFVVSGDWTVSGTWTSCAGGTPLSTDTVQIMAGHTVSLSISKIVAGLTIGTGGAGTTSTLTLAGTSGAILTVNGACYFNAGTLANMQLNGGTSIVCNGATAGDYLGTVPSSIVQVINGGVLVLKSTTQKLAGTALLRIASGSALNVTNFSSVGPNNAIISLMASTYCNYGTTTGLNSGLTFRRTDTGTAFLTWLQPVAFAGAFDITTGTLDISSVYTTATLTATSTVTLGSGGTLALERMTLVSGFTCTSSGGNLLFTGAMTINGPNVNGIACPITQQALLTTTLATSAGAITLPNMFTYLGTLSVTGTNTVTVYINAGSSSSFTLPANANAVISGSSTIRGSLSGATGSYITIQDGTIPGGMQTFSITSAMELRGTNMITITPTSSTLGFGMTGVTLASSATLIVKSASSVGTVTVAASRLIVGSGASVQFDGVRIASGQVWTGAGTVFFNGLNVNPTLVYGPNSFTAIDSIVGPQTNPETLYLDTTSGAITFREMAFGGSILSSGTGTDRIMLDGLSCLDANCLIGTNDEPLVLVGSLTGTVYSRGAATMNLTLTVPASSTLTVYGADSWTSLTARFVTTGSASAIVLREMIKTTSVVVAPGSGSIRFSGCHIVTAAPIIGTGITVNGPSVGFTTIVSVVTTFTTFESWGGTLALAANFVMTTGDVLSTATLNTTAPGVHLTITCSQPETINIVYASLSTGSMTWSGPCTYKGKIYLPGTLALRVGTALAANFNASGPGTLSFEGTTVYGPNNRMLNVNNMQATAGSTPWSRWDTTNGPIVLVKLENFGNTMTVYGNSANPFTALLYRGMLSSSVLQTGGIPLVLAGYPGGDLIVANRSTTVTLGGTLYTSFRIWSTARDALTPLIGVLDLSTHAMTVGTNMSISSSTGFTSGTLTLDGCTVVSIPTPLTMSLLYGPAVGSTTYFNAMNWIEPFDGWFGTIGLIGSTGLFTLPFNSYAGDGARIVNVGSSAVTLSGGFQSQVSLGYRRATIWMENCIISGTFLISGNASLTGPSLRIDGTLQFTFLAQPTPRLYSITTTTGSGLLDLTLVDAVLVGPLSISCEVRGSIAQTRTLTAEGGAGVAVSITMLTLKTGPFIVSAAVTVNLLVADRASVVIAPRGFATSLTLQSSSSAVNGTYTATGSGLFTFTLAGRSGATTLNGTNMRLEGTINVPAGLSNALTILNGPAAGLNPFTIQRVAVSPVPSYVSASTVISSGTGSGILSFIGMTLPSGVKIFGSGTVNLGDGTEVIGPAPSGQLASTTFAAPASGVLTFTTATGAIVFASAFSHNGGSTISIESGGLSTAGVTFSTYSTSHISAAITTDGGAVTINAGTVRGSLSAPTRSAVLTVTASVFSTGTYAVSGPTDGTKAYFFPVIAVGGLSTITIGTGISVSTGATFTGPANGAVTFSGCEIISPVSLASTLIVNGPGAGITTVISATFQSPAWSWGGHTLITRSSVVSFDKCGATSAGATLNTTAGSSVSCPAMACVSGALNLAGPLNITYGKIVGITGTCTIAGSAIVPGNAALTVHGFVNVGANFAISGKGGMLIRSQGEVIGPNNGLLNANNMTGPAAGTTLAFNTAGGAIVVPTLEWQGTVMVTGANAFQIQTVAMYATSTLSNVGPNMAVAVGSAQSGLNSILNGFIACSIGSACNVTLYGQIPAAATLEVDPNNAGTTIALMGGVTIYGTLKTWDLVKLMPGFAPIGSGTLFLNAPTTIAGPITIGVASVTHTSAAPGVLTIDTTGGSVTMSGTFQYSLNVNLLGTNTFAVATSLVPALAMPVLTSYGATMTISAGNLGGSIADAATPFSLFLSVNINAGDQFNLVSAYASFYGTIYINTNTNPRFSGSIVAGAIMYFSGANGIAGSSVITVPATSSLSFGGSMPILSGTSVSGSGTLALAGQVTVYGPAINTLNTATITGPGVGVTVLFDTSSGAVTLPRLDFSGSLQHTGSGSNTLTLTTINTLTNTATITTSGRPIAILGGQLSGSIRHTGATPASVSVTGTVAAGRSLSFSCTLGAMVLTANIQQIALASGSVVIGNNVNIGSASTFQGTNSITNNVTLSGCTVSGAPTFSTVGVIGPQAGVTTVMSLPVTLPSLDWWSGTVSLTSIGTLSVSLPMKVQSGARFQGGTASQFTALSGSVLCDSDVRFLSVGVNSTLAVTTGSSCVVHATSALSLWATAFPPLPPTGVFTVGSGVTLGAGMTVTGSGVVVLQSGSTISASSAYQNAAVVVPLAASVTVDVTSVSAQFSKTFQISGSVTVTGSGSFTAAFHDLQMVVPGASLTAASGHGITVLSVGAVSALQGTITAAADRTFAITGAVQAGAALVLNGPPGGGSAALTGAITVVGSGNATINSGLNVTSALTFIGSGGGATGFVRLNGALVLSQPVCTTVNVFGPLAPATTTIAVTAPLLLPSLAGWTGTVLLYGGGGSGSMILSGTGAVIPPNCVTATLTQASGGGSTGVSGLITLSGTTAGGQSSALNVVNAVTVAAASSLNITGNPLDVSANALVAGSIGASIIVPASSVLRLSNLVLSSVGGLSVGGTGSAVFGPGSTLSTTAVSVSNLWLDGTTTVSGQFGCSSAVVHGPSFGQTTVIGLTGGASLSLPGLSSWRGTIQVDGTNAGGGTLAFTTPALSMSVDSRLSLDLNANLLISGGQLAGMITCAGGTTALTISGTVSGGGNTFTIKSTSGSVTLSGSQTISGGGTLRLLDGVSFNSGLVLSGSGVTSVALFSGCTLSSSSGQPIFNSIQIFGPASGATTTVNAPATITLPSWNGWAGTTALTAAGEVVFTSAATQPGAQLLSGLCSISGSIAVTGTFLFADTMSVASGTLSIVGATPNSAAVLTASLPQAATVAGTLSLGLGLTVSLGTSNIDVKGGGTVAVNGATLTTPKITGVPNSVLKLNSGSMVGAVVSGDITIESITGPVSGSNFTFTDATELDPPLTLLSGVVIAQSTFLPAMLIMSDPASTLLIGGLLTIFSGSTLQGTIQMIGASAPIEIDSGAIVNSGTVLTLIGYSASLIDASMRLPTIAGTLRVGRELVMTQSGGPGIYGTGSIVLDGCTVQSGINFGALIVYGPSASGVVTAIAGPYTFSTFLSLAGTINLSSGAFVFTNATSSGLGASIASNPFAPISGSFVSSGSLAFSNVKVTTALTLSITAAGAGLTLSGTLDATAGTLLLASKSGVGITLGALTLRGVMVVSGSTIVTVLNSFAVTSGTALAVSGMSGGGSFAAASAFLIGGTVTLQSGIAVASGATFTGNDVAAKVVLTGCTINPNVDFTSILVDGPALAATTTFHTGSGSTAVSLTPQLTALAGTVSITGTGSFAFAGGAIALAGATITVSVTSLGVSGSITGPNSGTVTVTGGVTAGLTLTLNGSPAANFVCSCAIASGGRLIVSTGVTLAAGSTISGAGTLQVDSGAVLSGPLSASCAVAGPAVSGSVSVLGAVTFGPNAVSWFGTWNVDASAAFSIAVCGVASSTSAPSAGITTAGGSVTISAGSLPRTITVISSPPSAALSISGTVPLLSSLVISGGVSGGGTTLTGTLMCAGSTAALSIEASIYVLGGTQFTGSSGIVTLSGCVIASGVIFNAGLTYRGPTTGLIVTEFATTSGMPAIVVPNLSAWNGGTVRVSGDGALVLSAAVAPAGSTLAIAPLSTAKVSGSVAISTSGAFTVDRLAVAQSNTFAITTSGGGVSVAVTGGVTCEGVCTFGAGVTLSNTLTVNATGLCVAQSDAIVAGATVFGTGSLSLMAASSVVGPTTTLSVKSILGPAASTGTLSIVASGGSVYLPNLIAGDSITISAGLFPVVLSAASLSSGVDTLGAPLFIRNSMLGAMAKVTSKAVAGSTPIQLIGVTAASGATISSLEAVPGPLYVENTRLPTGVVVDYAFKLTVNGSSTLGLNSGSVSVLTVVPGATLTFDSAAGSYSVGTLFLTAPCRIEISPALYASTDALGFIPLNIGSGVWTASTDGRIEVQNIALTISTAWRIAVRGLGTSYVTLAGTSSIQSLPPLKITYPFSGADGSGIGLTFDQFDGVLEQFSFGGTSAWDFTSVVGVGPVTINMCYSGVSVVAAHPPNIVITQPQNCSATCSSFPCQHAGVCNQLQRGQYSCLCQPGYSGAVCQTEINECASQPCQFGGECKDLLNSFTCKCAAGYSGLRCETNVNECASQPCLNGGTCVDGVASYSCVCPAGYSGAHCNANINECASTPCRHGATCVDALNSFSCSCADPYIGTLCEACDGCNTGKCVITPDNVYRGFTCTYCPASFSGSTCDQDVNHLVFGNGEFVLYFAATPGASANTSAWDQSDADHLSIIAGQPEGAFAVLSNSRALDGSLRVYLIVNRDVFPGGFDVQLSVEAVFVLIESGDSSITELGVFQGTTSGDTAVLPPPPGPTLYESLVSVKWYLAAIGGLLFVLFLLNVALKRKHPESRPAEFIFFAMTIINSATDIGFVFNLKSQGSSQELYFQLAAAFLGATFLWNLINVCRIVWREMYKTDFQRWLKSPGALSFTGFCAFCALANPNNLSLLDCRLLDMAVLSAPVHQFTKNSILLVGLGSTALQNIPLFVLQLKSSANSWTPITLGAVIMSAMSISIGISKRLVLVCAVAVHDRQKAKHALEGKTHPKKASGGEPHSPVGTTAAGAGTADANTTANPPATSRLTDRGHTDRQPDPKAAVGVAIEMESMTGRRTVREAFTTLPAASPSHVKDGGTTPPTGHSARAQAHAVTGRMASTSNLIVGSAAPHPPPSSGRNRRVGSTSPHTNTTMSRPLDGENVTGVMAGGGHHSQPSHHSLHTPTANHPPPAAAAAAAAEEALPGMPAPDDDGVASSATAPIIGGHHVTRASLHQHPTSAAAASAAVDSSSHAPIPLASSVPTISESAPAAAPAPSVAITAADGLVVASVPPTPTAATAAPAPTGGGGESITVSDA